MYAHAIAKVDVHSGAFKHVQQRQHRQRDVLARERVTLGGVANVREKVVVSEHHALWLARRAACVDERREIVSCRPAAEERCKLGVSGTLFASDLLELVEGKYPVTAG